MNKTILITFSYWMLAVIIIAIILLSLGYPFALGLLMGSLFLPGTFIVKYLLPKALKEKGRRRILSSVFLFSGVAVLEFLLIVSVHIWISDHPYPSIAGVLVNPMFMAVVITLLCLGDWYLSGYLSAALPQDKTVTLYPTGTKSRCSLQKSYTWSPMTGKYRSWLQREEYSVTRPESHNGKASSAMISLEYIAHIL
jgi:hypothetical protein